jgi:hypothetical protein
MLGGVMSDHLAMNARRYLLAIRGERAAAKAAVLVDLPKSVFPTVQVAISLCSEFNPLKNLNRTPPQQISTDSPRYLWARYVANPAVRDVYEIIEAGGDNAIDALIRLLWERDPLVKVFAGLILFQIKRPTKRSAEQIFKTFNYLNSAERDKQYYLESALPLLLSYVLARSGNQSIQTAIENIVRKNNSSLEQEEKELCNTTLNFIFVQTGK